MLYQFRIDSDQRETLLERLERENQLCQGWGGGCGGGLSLAGLEFVAKTAKAYDLQTTRIPSNLTRIRDFRDGDVVVTPHLPSRGRVSVHIVDGDYPACYSYVEDDPVHLNHRVRVRESFGLSGSINDGNARLVPWRGKLQWRRLPVLRIPEYEKDFAALIAALRVDPDSKFEASSLDEYYDSLLTEVLGFVEDRLQKINPSGGLISFEAVCETLITDAGFTVVERNSYDRTGGDVDLKCVRSRSDVSPFESGETLLFVQIKKHSGVSGPEGVRQVLQMMRAEPAANGCVMTLATSFDEEAEQLARSEGITLLAGRDIGPLLLRRLAYQGGVSGAAG